MKVITDRNVNTKLPVAKPLEHMELDTTVLRQKITEKHYGQNVIQTKWYGENGAEKIVGIRIKSPITSTKSKSE